MIKRLLLYPHLSANSHKIPIKSYLIFLNPIKSFFNI